ncbi:DNA topoisomerase IB [Janibacter sp. YIM B02568]|uniref:DNA topoisomerase IB n=1 Tax=Janibacter endophyticus TaxID=2806261 RepID=UPI00194E68CB|nr:DNA topoisomerase IB [Janibacter endophyticus]MBM6545006.1 DNA topoisomerase IB [Janibacter endophyticus]
MRLRTVSPRSRGWTRRRAGRGFTYLDHEGRRLPEADVERIRSLAIPPAWEDVWVCPLPNGHIQAVGTDAAGRRQYLYHPAWRTQRDEAKFDRVIAAAGRLPTVRARVLDDLALEGMPLTRATATAVRLLDLGSFRIGNQTYTDEHGSFGLTTLERSHVRATKGALVFAFTGKSGIEQEVVIDDPVVTSALTVLRTRRGGSTRLLAYRDGRRWADLDAALVNAYLAELFGGELTAKDFRTWHATVHAAVALARSEEPGDTKASRRRAVKAAVEEVSAYLGNTPTIAKNSYIDPRVLDLYENGRVVQLTARRRTPEQEQAYVERAVRRMLTKG